MRLGVKDGHPSCRRTVPSDSTVGRKGDRPDGGRPGRLGCQDCATPSVTTHFSSASCRLTGLARRLHLPPAARQPHAAPSNENVRPSGFENRERAMSITPGTYRNAPTGESMNITRELLALLLLLAVAAGGCCSLGGPCQLPPSRPQAGQPCPLPEVPQAKYPFQNLVFEGGGVRGVAYAGALDVLDRAGILSQIQAVAGTSAGAITAALVALGY